MRGYLIGGLIGLMVGLGLPVAAQSVVRVYGIQSNGTITPVLVDSAGRLQVVVITP